MPRNCLLQARMSPNKRHLAALTCIGDWHQNIVRELAVTVLRFEPYLQVASQTLGQSVEATSGTVLNRIHSLLFRPKPYAPPEPAQERIPKILHHIFLSGEIKGSLT